MKVTSEQIRLARRVDLFEILRHGFRDCIVDEGNSLRLRENNSISIKRGYAGYKDFATGETGNAIDLLTKHLGYSVPEAVAILIGQTAMTSAAFAAVERPVKASNGIELPPRASNYDRVYAYLRSRGIAPDIIKQLVISGLLYQSEHTNNCVFLSKKRDFAEIRGTLSNKPFHGVLKTAPDRFWFFAGDVMPTTAAKPVAYICESAIDAISLYSIHRSCRENTAAYYCSLAGVANQQTIDRIKRHAYAILAVDNDAAGELCRDANPDIPHIIPLGKDWNDELKGGYMK